MIIDFYPRPPRGGRHFHDLYPFTRFYFYPRPPRGGRPLDDAEILMAGNISIHALREEGDGPCSHHGWPAQISIHALREEGDRMDWKGGGKPVKISIHALREEGDGWFLF